MRMVGWSRWNLDAALPKASQFTGSNKLAMATKDFSRLSEEIENERSANRKNTAKVKIYPRVHAHGLSEKKVFQTTESLKKTNWWSCVQLLGVQ